MLVAWHASSIIGCGARSSPWSLQCGRFQPLGDFDDAKRTCRRKVRPLPRQGAREAHDLGKSGAAAGCNLQNSSCAPV